MADKLSAGDEFPGLTLNVGENNSLEVPGGLDSDYAIVLFYRGHW